MAYPPLDTTSDEYSNIPTSFAMVNTIPTRMYSPSNMASTIPVRISYRATYRRGRSSVTRNCNNLIRIQALTSQENENEAGTTEKYFVLSVCKILACPYNEDREVLWALMRPN
jgi:hypothetical protein